MKKIIGATLLAIIAVGFGASVQAEETTVTYDVASTYTLSIPAKTLTDDDQEWRVGTSKHDIAPSKVLELSLSADNLAIDDAGTVTLSQNSGSNILTTTVLDMSTGNLIVKGYVILSATGSSDTGEKKTIAFNEIRGKKKAGTYTAQLNFTAEIKEE